MGISMNLAEIASCLTALIATVALWKNIRDKRFDDIRNEMKEGFAKIDERFEKVDERFDKNDIQLHEIRKDVNSINVRLSVLEAETILCQTIPDVNNRSEAAKKMWKLRKMKALESQKR